MKKLFAIILTVFFCCYLFPAAVFADNKSDDITIVFTHDLHSHIDSFERYSSSVGGFARIKTFIDNVKTESQNIVVVDGGDFSMGTLYQTLFANEAPEYRLLSALGYDAITLGNHEFDLGVKSLVSMQKTAISNSTSPLPPIVATNIEFTDNENKLDVQEYTIIKKGKFKIAIFGLMGKDAAELILADGVYFDDYIETAKNIVSEIEKLYSPDLIICLSHSGTGESVEDEDVKLATEVPDIDVIVSGHTHTLLPEPIIVGDTIIASCGEYGEYIGKISLNITGEKVSLNSYSLRKLDYTCVSDSEISTSIDYYRNKLSDYLANFGYESADRVVANSPFDFANQNEMSNVLAEQPLGNLISDAFIHAVKNAEGKDYTPVDIAIAPIGLIRTSIEKGDITVSEIYEICSLGSGKDNLSGYPLCTAYLTGKELWALAEVDASVSGIMSYAQLYFSGLCYSANTNRMFLNRVYDCWLVDENGNRIEIEDDKLYRVVAATYSAEMLELVNTKSFGLLKIAPKDKDGNLINDFSKFVVYKNGAEVKEWSALADYLSSFPMGENDVPVIPNKYSIPEGRKNINNEFDLKQIFTSWNYISCCVLAIILLVIAIIVSIVIAIVRNKNKKKRALLVDSEI